MSGAELKALARLAVQGEALAALVIGQEKVSDPLQWTREAIVRISSDMSLLVIAFKTQLTVFEQQDASFVHASSFQTPLPDHSEDDPVLPPREKVTDMVIFDLKVKRGEPDQHCIVAGFDSGSMRMYSKTGTVLFGQMFHSTGVVRIKLQPSSGMPPDLCLLYHQVAVVIESASVSQCLRACVIRANRGDESIDIPPLHVKKWGFEDTQECLDIVCKGISAPNAYDLMVMGSKGPPEGAFTYVLAGYHPSLSVYTTAGCDRPFFSVASLATSMATNLGKAVFSVVSSFWGSSKKPAQGPSHAAAQKDIRKLPAAALEPATQLPLQTSLADTRRKIHTLSASPHGDYLASSDSFGRVMLVDAASCVILRLWKGYREAQCAWLLATEDAESADDRLMAGSSLSRSASIAAVPRTALFLVIFAARRGILEIWSVPGDARVAAFNIGTDAMLMTTGSFGTLSHGRPSPSCFVLRGSGKLEEIRVDFHLSQRGNSARTKDKHVLRTLSGTAGAAFLESSEQDSVQIALGRITSGISELQSYRSLGDALVAVLVPGITEESLEACLAAVLERCISLQGADETNADACALKGRVAVLRQQIQAYRSIVTSFPDPPGRLPDLGTGTCSLNLLCFPSPAEAQRLEAVLSASIREERTISPPSSVPVASLPKFLCSLNLAGLVGSPPQPLARIRVDIKPSLADDERLPVSHGLFRSLASGYCDLDHLVKSLGELQISARDLGSLFLDWFLRLPVTHILHDKVLEAVFAVVLELNRIAREEDMLFGRVEHPATEWWSAVVDTCQHTPAVSQALPLLLMGRSVVFGGRDAPAAPSDGKTFSRSEILHMEIQKTIRMLEDAACLACLPHGVSSSTPTPVFSFFSPYSAFRSSSVRQLLAGEFVPDALVRHLLALGLAPSHVVELRRAGGTVVDNLASCESVGTVLQSLSGSLLCTMRPDMLAARASWILMGVWHQDRSRADCLKGAADFVRAVEDPFVVQRVVVEMWELHLRQYFASIVSLNEKVGKAIKERLCTKHFGVESEVLAETLRAIVVLFEALREKTDVLEVQKKASRADPKVPTPCPLFDLSSEARWSELLEKRAGSGAATLHEDLRVDERTSFRTMLSARWIGDVDSNTVNGHELLAKLMFLVQVHDMKSSRVLALFPLSDRERFFTPLQHSEETWEDFGDRPLNRQVSDDEEVTETRRLFMPRATSLVLHEVPASANALTDPAVRQVLDLSRRLRVNTDWSHGTLATALYVCGFDADADEILGQVSDSEQYSPLLVDVARLRVARLVAEDTGAGGALKLAAHLPTEVQQWVLADPEPPLVKLYGEVKPSTLEATLRLLSRIIPMLPEGSAESLRAKELLEACEAEA